MAYEIYIGDRMFSSWSLRGWLMLEKFSLPHTVHLVGLYSGTMAQEMAHLAPARLVPALRTPEGTVVGESLAIAETLAEQNPDAGLWPADPAQRAAARWLAAEMVAGFSGPVHPIVYFVHNRGHRLNCFGMLALWVIDRFGPCCSRI